MEETLTSRYNIYIYIYIYMEGLDKFSHRTDDVTNVFEGRSEHDDFLTINPPANLEPEGGRRARE